MKLGVGYRREMAAWIKTQPRYVSALELTAEHFFRVEDAVLAELGKNYEIYVHALSLSLGTPGPMDNDLVERFARVVRAANPRWISEHIAFTRTTDVDLGHLNPVPPTRELLEVISEHVRELCQRCQRPFLLENITSYVKLVGDFSEPEFLNSLCESADCGLLLDVTNLFINSRNHGYDPISWLHELNPQNIRQLHIVGYSREGDRYTDSHAVPIQTELIELAREVVKYAPVEAIILERDEEIPDPTGLEAEIAKLERIIGRD